MRFIDMQISKISSNSFGLTVTDNAKNCIEKEFRFEPKKMLEFDYITGTYPDDITLDITRNDKKFDIKLNDLKNEMTTQQNNIKPKTIKNMIHKFLKSFYK